jgi:hypothetical protein
VTDRLQPPEPPFVSELDVRAGGARCRAAIGEPTTVADGWWVTLAWIADDEGVVPFRRLASPAGPPPDPPLARLGPSMAGNLSGMILEEDGRQMLRLRLGVPPVDDRLPWEAPLIVLAAIRWEPMRAATMSDTDLAEVALAAFGRSVEGLTRA